MGLERHKYQRFCMSIKHPRCSDVLCDAWPRLGELIDRTRLSGSGGTHGTVHISGARLPNAHLLCQTCGLRGGGGRGAARLGKLTM